MVLIADAITPPPFPAQTEAIAPANLSSPVLPCPERLAFCPRSASTKPYVVTGTPATDS
jgi:hypothetical protein